MNKLLTCLFLSFLSISLTFGQQDRYSWKIGVHGGLANYYGDLSHQVFDLPHQFKQPIKDFNFIAYGLSVEYHLSKTFGLRLFGMKSQFKASDRSYDNHANYDRALNVQTDLIDASLLGIVYFDNGLILGNRSVISPYFLFGGGLSYFENKGDLLSNSNDRYYYWSDRTIRTQDENGGNANTAQIIEQDYHYETTLSSLKTEGNAYDPITWNVALGLGLKVRLSQRFHLHLEALLRYTGTDYLDDVSDNYSATYTDNFQAYAANPSASNRAKRGDSPEMNDWYTLVGLSVHYSFGQKTYAIQPAIIYTENVLESVDSIATTIATSPTSDSTVMTTTSTTTVTTTTVTTIPEVDSVTTRSNPTVQTTTDSVNQTPAPTMDSVNMVIPVINKVDSTVSNSTTTVVDSIVIDSLSNRPSTVNSPVPVPNNGQSLQILEQKYNYELQLQQQQYEGKLREQALLHQLEIEKKRTTPNTKEQELKFQLQIQQLNYEHQLKQQALLNQLEIEKKRPIPNTSEQDLKLQQQKFDTELQLQRLNYEHQLKLQQFQHLLHLERLKNGSDTLGFIQPIPEISSPSIIQPETVATNSNSRMLEQQLNRLTNAIEDQQQQINLLLLNKNETKPSQPAAIAAPTSQSAAATNSLTTNDLIKAQAAQNQLQLKIKELELALIAANNQPKTIVDTMTIIRKDSIYVNQDNNSGLTKQLNQQQQFNNDLVAKLAVINNQRSNQQKTIDSLQQVIAKIESEKSIISGSLATFLAQKKGSYVTKIYFDIGKSSLAVQAKETLTTLVHYLEKYPTVRFTVKGFASKTGRSDVNDRLSAERALAVATFLKQSNIQADRITTNSLGAQDSQSSNELDRRAEVHLSF